jgi:hypothetical protein
MWLSTNAWFLLGLREVEGVCNQRSKKGICKLAYVLQFPDLIEFARDYEWWLNAVCQV